MTQVVLQKAKRLDPLIYRKGYKYQIPKGVSCSFQLPHGYGVEWDGEWFKLDLTGKITACEGYAWDGPSGPTLDTDDFMCSSLPHDMLYQLFGLGVLSADQYREAADQIMDMVSESEGMPWWRRAYTYLAVRTFGAKPARRGDATYIIPLKGD